ncbi:hypothetical protein C9374_006373 [Naegleria lovaniensis]|uniref:BING4 C-terminal domain-containing protein n=1 Tax=Naegleria lovaniensis TaxID=51637 RepID=A0AA88GLW4_NAELO|nr:uncharacterized protein C9374_006373 [Naegleria lovaniensis]KAG2381384.1 hypothetical protein C9374_006373 [Naegleria lovaniensis]
MEPSSDKLKRKTKASSSHDTSSKHQQQQQHSTNYQPLVTDKDIERANELQQQEQAQKLELAKKEQLQRKERNEFLFKKAKNLLKTYEKSKYYQKTIQIQKDALQKYKRKSIIDEKPLPKRELAYFQYKNKLANKQEVSRNIVWSDVDRAKAEATLARSDVLRIHSQVERGIELDPENDIFTKTSQLSQNDLLQGVDENTRKKIYDIELTQYSPYRLQYSLSGRKLLLGGVKGHVAALDWRRFEMTHENVLNEPVKAVQWLMDDGMYALAQSPYTYVYNEQGVEIHMCRDFNRVEHLSYLPFHFLLVGGMSHNGQQQEGQIIYKDISLGENVAQIKLSSPMTCMVANPYNAIMCVGHLNGTLSMVQPRDRDYKPVVTMFCHQASPLKHVCIDPTGRYMITSASDDTCKVWDIRNTYQPIMNVNTQDEPIMNVNTQDEYQRSLYPSHLRPKSGDHITSMAISQTGMLALSLKHGIAIYKNFTHIHERDKELYLLHKLPSHTTVCDLSFCPYEDILGVGHSRGFSSLLVPGSGSTSFDSKMPNPYFTDKQVKDFNVRTLLEKIPHEMICLDPSLIGTSGFKETQKGLLSTKGSSSHTNNSSSISSSSTSSHNNNTNHSSSTSHNTASEETTTPPLQHIQLSDELKQELNRVGLSTSNDKRKRLTTSKDEYRQELFDKYTEMKNSIPQHWYDEGEDADALDRFASLKKRKIKFDEKKKHELRKQQQETEQQDRVKQLMKQLLEKGEEEEDTVSEDEKPSSSSSDHHPHVVNNNDMIKLSVEDSSDEEEEQQQQPNDDDEIGVRQLSITAEEDDDTTNQQDNDDAFEDDDDDDDDEGETMMNEIVDPFA